MSEPTLEQLKASIAAMELENGKLRNTVNFQAMEMLAIARATNMPIPPRDQRTPPQWKMENLAQWVTLYCDTLIKQRDEFRNQLTDQNSP